MPTSEDISKAMEINKLVYELSRKYDNDELLAQIVTETISRASNSSGSILIKAVEQMQNEHRTLQQNIMRGLIIPFIKAKAEDYSDVRYDDRNRATCMAAYEMYNVVKKMEYFPFI